MESFFRTLRTERVMHWGYTTRDQARVSIPARLVIRENAVTALAVTAIVRLGILGGASFPDNDAAETMRVRRSGDPVNPLASNALRGTSSETA
jgi:hypothetical protein